MGIALYTSCLALCLLPFCSMAVNAAKGSASVRIGSNQAIAKVIQVTPAIDNEWIVAVKDSKSPTGYSVNVTQFLHGYFVKPYFHVFMFSRYSLQDKLEFFFASRLCDLLDPDDDYYPQKNFMPRQIVDLILPGRYGNCSMAESTKPIKAGGTVDTDPKTNKNVNFPKSSPYQLVVNILSSKYINNPETEYLFQVVFVIGGNGQISGSVSGNTSGVSNPKST